MGKIGISTPEPAPQAVPESSVTSAPAIDLSTFRLKQYFNLDHYDTMWEEKVGDIQKIFREKGINNPDEIELELRKLEQRLGQPPMGEHRIAHLYRYLKLDRQLGDTIRELESYHAKRSTQSI